MKVLASLPVRRARCKWSFDGESLSEFSREGVARLDYGSIPLPLSGAGPHPTLLEGQMPDGEGKAAPGILLLSHWAQVILERPPEWTRPLLRNPLRFAIPYHD